MTKLKSICWIRFLLCCWFFVAKIDLYLLCRLWLAFSVPSMNECIEIAWKSFIVIEWRDHRNRRKTPVSLVDFLGFVFFVVHNQNPTKPNNIQTEREFQERSQRKTQFEKKWKNERNIKIPIAAIVTCKGEWIVQQWMRTHTKFHSHPHKLLFIDGNESVCV